MNNNLLWRMLVGQVINNQYHLKDLIGAGGYGGVFLADDVIDDTLIRKVAIKMLVPDNKNKQQQLNEIIANANLQQPNLIRCFHGGKCHLNGADFLYLVMEVADFSLEKRLTQGVLSETEATLLVQDIAEALVYLHNQPQVITHRDLKPGNVLRVGDKWRLSDFGLVKVIGTDSVVDTINLMGTARYAPPEAYQGKVGTAWDVWSLGIIIVEALTGKPPFQGETEQQLQKQICEKDPDLSGLPQKFERIARGCLEKDRKKRWKAQQVLDVFSINTKKLENVVSIYNNKNNTRIEIIIELLMWLGQIGDIVGSRLLTWGMICWLLILCFPLVPGALAKHYHDLGETQKALEVCNLALKIMPSNIMPGSFSIIYTNRGNIYDDLGEKQKAIDDYNQALKINFNDAEAYSNRGNVYNDLGEKQKALNDYKNAATLYKRQGKTNLYKQVNTRIKELSRRI